MGGEQLISAVAAPKPREPAIKLSLDEQLRLFEEWAIFMFCFSCCPLEY